MNDNKPESLVSIAVPVYNSAPYLERCLTSISEQTYKNLQIICVDDCSNKETSETLDSLAKKDNRIEVIHLRKRVGAGEARNIGMRHADGDYIMFLDSDDYFERDMVELLHKDMLEYDADMCVCSFLSFSDVTGERVSDFYPKEKIGTTNRGFRMNQLGEDGLTYFNPGPWNKMFKKSFLKDKEVLFQSLSSSNDVSFAFQAALKASMIIYCKSRPLVNYRTNSAIQISNNRRSINLYEAIINVIDKLGEGITRQQLVQIIYVYISLVVYEFNKCKDISVNRRLYELTRELLVKYRDDIKVDNSVIAERIRLFKSMNYESGWMKNGLEFDVQINAFFTALEEHMKSNKDILIWGNGAKSRSLQRVLRKKGYDRVLVTDITNNDVGEKTVSGYKIIGSERARMGDYIIIASNHSIYCSLKKEGIVCVDLDEVCQLV